MPVKILFVTSEIHPLVKTGGLADVSHALPLALRQAGLDVRVLVPGYPGVMARLGKASTVCTLEALAPIWSPARLLEGRLADTDLPLWVVDCPSLYERPGGPYQGPDGRDWDDNPLRFGFLCHVGSWLCSAPAPLSWSPDVVHCNDWQAGLIPALLRHRQGPSVPSVMTIHNLAFQGNFDPLWVTRLGLPMESFHMHGLEFYGQLSFLKAGINYADRITTVSPRYAQEIQTPEMGCGLEGLLRQRSADLVGILNGIDDSWNPARDPTLPAAFDAQRLAVGKRRNKTTLQQDSGLTKDPQVPLLGLVSRLTYQKGIDLLLDTLPALMEHPLQLIVLGSGEADMESRLREAADAYPGRVSVTLDFDEPLSHRIIAGSDLFLMPSRFEPCGLAQMYAMSYGTPPVVRETGGLADTVVDCTESALGERRATGFTFLNATPDALMAAVQRALATYELRTSWRQLQKTGMRRDFSWKRAASDYAGIYHALSSRA
ncbi:MAG: glycogen synthase GlgA [Betaproteobacteria bacterium]|nr:glycogen synthase GlgA [Betaproteobacteria bacterium]